MRCERAQRRRARQRVYLIAGFMPPLGPRRMALDGRRSLPVFPSALLLATETPLTFLGRKLEATRLFPAMIVLPHPLGMGTSPGLAYLPYTERAIER